MCFAKGSLWIPRCVAAKQATGGTTLAKYWSTWTTNTFLSQCQYPLVSTKHPHRATQLFEDQCIFLEPPQLWACNQAICGGISGLSFENAPTTLRSASCIVWRNFPAAFGPANFDFAQISHRGIGKVKRTWSTPMFGDCLITCLQFLKGRRRVLRHHMTFPAVRNYYVNAKSSVHESEMIINPLFPSSNFNKQIFLV